MNPLFMTPLLALVCSLIAHALSLVIFPRLGLLDFPERYGLKRGRLPYPVGIVSVLLFVVFFVFVAPQNNQALMLVLAISLLGIFSFIDDRRPLPAAFRIIVQIIAALLIFLGGAHIYSLTNPLEGIVGGSVISLDQWTMIVPYFGSIPLWSAVFTILWIGLTTNALNWFDGISGQVSVLSAISFLTIGFLSLRAGVDQPFLALIAFTLAAISIGSAFVTIPQLAIMGDSGAMFFGFLMGVLTIYAGGKVATGFLVLGVPLFDFVLVLIRRIRKGVHPLRGNTKDEHLHHRLLSIGWSPKAVIALTGSMGAAFGITALFLNTWQKFVAAIILFLVMLYLSWYSRPRKVTIKN